VFVCCTDFYCNKLQVLCVRNMREVKKHRYCKLKSSFKIVAHLILSTNVTSWLTLPLIEYSTWSARPVSKHGGKKNVSAKNSNTAIVINIESHLGRRRCCCFITFLPTVSKAMNGTCILKNVSHAQLRVCMPIIYLDNRTAVNDLTLAFSQYPFACMSDSMNEEDTGTSQVK